MNTKYNMRSNYILMKSSIENIRDNDETTFTLIPVFSAEDINTFNEINLSEPKTFNFFGSVYSDKFAITIINFFESLGNDKKLSKLLFNILTNKVIIPFLVSMKVDCLWITFRVVFPIGIFKIPRWHFDGLFYDTTVPYQMKLAGTLVGPGTLLKKTNHAIMKNYDNVRKKLYLNFDYKNYDEEKDLQNRQILDELLSSVKTIQASNNEIVIFTVGNVKKSAIHSEPDITSKRLFFSIVVGNSDNIRQLSQRWNMNFID
jgi:hypothetical protein